MDRHASQGHTPDTFRWQTKSDQRSQPTLFAEEDLVERHVGIGAYHGLEFVEVEAKKIINAVPPASKMPFRHTINAYRGCSHACTYCFARPSHRYLGMDMGEDFERRIVVKVNAVERLRAELRPQRWQGHRIAMGTNTDPYQAAEGKYHLTRGIIEVLGQAANPFSILTKSTLILRDLDVLTRAARRTTVRCDLSIGTLDAAVWQATEPGAPHPRRRLEALRRLNQAGIPTGVLIAPVIPGLSDHRAELQELSRACADAGAVSVRAIALHLRPGVREHFMGWLAQHYPHLSPQFARRYRTSYLPADQQRAITSAVALRPRSSAG